MRKSGTRWGWIGVLIVVLAGVVCPWPADTRATPPRFDASILPGDLDAWLAAREGVFSDITAGTQKQIVWAHERGTKTPFALVYIHGFSASSQEVRPTPDLIAADLEANLYFTRLAGHARGVGPFAEASADDWLVDLAEALAIGARLGDRVIVMATSTGGTIALAGLGTPDLRAAMPGADKVAGLALISPNLRFAKRAIGLVLDLPLARHWIPLLRREDYSFTPDNPGYAKYWTTRYPMAAVFELARIMRIAREVKVEAMRLPLLVIYSPDDRVVDAGSMLGFFKNWGGPLTLSPKPLRDGMDPDAHVIAGAIRSPALTAEVAREVSDWAGGL